MLPVCVYVIGYKHVCAYVGQVFVLYIYDIESVCVCVGRGEMSCNPSDTRWASLRSHHQQILEIAHRWRGEPRRRWDGENSHSFDQGVDSFFFLLVEYPITFAPVLFAIVLFLFLCCVVLYRFSFFFPFWDTQITHCWIGRNVLLQIDTWRCFSWHLTCEWCRDGEGEREKPLKESSSISVDRPIPSPPLPCRCLFVVGGCQFGVVGINK